MLSPDDWKDLAELGGLIKDKESGWFRYLAGLGAGALTVMVTFGKGIQPGISGDAQRLALISLPLGVLFGSICSYVEVSLLRGHYRNLVEQKNRMLAGIVETGGPSVVRRTKLAKMCEKLCYLSFLVSLISLAVFAWTLPPSS